MLIFALEYRTAIDAITADETWGLGRFELTDEEWLIVKDLVNILEVSTVVYYPSMRR